MRETYLNSEELLDKAALDILRQGLVPGLADGRALHYNQRIKILYRLDDLFSVEERLEELSLDQVCGIGTQILDKLIAVEAQEGLVPDNLVLDMSGIYMDESGCVTAVYVPVILPEDPLIEPIYRKRIYALLEELLEKKEGGETITEEIESYNENNFGDWNALKEALNRSNLS